MSVLVIIIVLAVIVIGYFISTQRSLVNLDELCKNALSQIEVQLNSRFDAVIALAKTAAQYAKHESETIIEADDALGFVAGVPLAVILRVGVRVLVQITFNHSVVPFSKCLVFVLVNTLFAALH